MSPSLFEPRRLRESPEGPSSVEGRLARQLRTLSVYAPTPQLRRYSCLPRRRRYALAAIRIAVAVTVLLTVSEAATAMATYIVRRVWSLPGAVDSAPTPATPPKATHRGRRIRASQVSRVDGRDASPPEQPLQTPPRVESPTPPARVGLRSPEVDVATGASGRATPSIERRDMPPLLRPQPMVDEAKPSGTRPVESHQPITKEPSPSSIESGEPHVSRSAPLATRSSSTRSFAVDDHSTGSSSSVPSPTGSTSSGSSGSATSQVPADAVTQEAALLREALAALRRDRDAKRALATLDDHDRRFGHGTLAREASSIRAQALLQLGDNRRALQLLDRLSLWQEGYTGELRVIRGELRSLAGRCREALLDFEAVLRATSGTAPAEVARALFGRASCRARTGDSVGAEQDRQRYLKEFPQGPAARQLLSPP